MPRSRRDKQVNLTTVKKKTTGWKKDSVLSVRNLIDKHENAYAFKYEGPNARLKELREKLSGSSRFYQGSRKRLQVALGKNPATEYKENLSQLAEEASRSSGLLFTDLNEEEVQEALINSDIVLLARWQNTDSKVHRYEET